MSCSKIVFSLAMATTMLAAQETESRWRVSAFGTLGLAYNATGLAAYVREPSQPVGVVRSLDPNLDSRLGGQVNLDLTDELSFVGQALSRYRYDHTYTPVLSWAFLSYAPASGVQVRGGRLGWDVFPLSDTRNVGYSYLWVRPPADFFAPLLFTSLDGGDLSWTTPMGEGWNLKLKVGAGKACANDQIEMPPSSRFSLAGARLFGSLVELQGETLDVRLAYASAHPVRDYPAPVTDLQAALEGYAVALQDPGLAQEASALAFSANDFHYYSLGMSWHSGPLKVEAAGAGIHAAGTGPVPDYKMGYVSVGYRTGAGVPYLLVSRLQSAPQTPYLGALPLMGPQAAGLAEGVTDFLDQAKASQTTVALGLRWDFHPKAALKFQVDRVVADPNKDLLWAETKPGWDGCATIASATLDFVF